MQLKCAATSTWGAASGLMIEINSVPPRCCVRRELACPVPQPVEWLRQLSDVRRDPTGLVVG
jgi:hypothetical protein